MGRVLRIARHADRRLRKRTGWTRRAVRRAVRSLEDEGDWVSDGEVIYRELRWIIDRGMVVTVIPLRRSSGNGKQSLEHTQGRRRYKPRGQRYRRR